MCGIAGLVAWQETYRASRDMLEKVSVRLAHRGPDGQGIWLSHEDEIRAGRPQVAFVHRRLAIIDLDPRANQPLVDSDGRCIVFNGEIYNYRELRKQIAQLHPQRPWRTESDTEVLLAAYATWGRHCLRHLNGMFAFAIWDPVGGHGASANTLFVARDRMGQKPLYYASTVGGYFAFASEPAALRRLPWITEHVEMQSVADYLMWGCTPRGTVYRDIQKLAPATWMAVVDGQIEAHSYFDPNNPAKEQPLSHEAAVARTRELVTSAVRRQLVADVPVGCFLSGGIDSSIIVSAMRRAIPASQPLLTFSIGFDDRRYDETHYAVAVARRFRTDHRQFIVQPDAAEDLPKIAAAFGEPFGDSSALPTHYLARETRQHVKVALSGDGGDELFGGYDRYRAMAISERLQRLPRPLPSVLQSMRGLRGSHPKSPLSRLKRLLSTLKLPPAQRYASYMGIFSPDLVARLLAGGAAMAESAERLMVERYDLLHGPPLGDDEWDRDVVQAALATDRVFYLPEDLLTKLDRCSMLHALEVRSPFMDHELVHFAASLASSELLRGARGKLLLREAFARDLPEDILTRGKMGFAVPIGQWLRNSLRPMLHDLLRAEDSFASQYFHARTVRRLLSEHDRGRVDHSQRLYALLMLELWWRQMKSP